MICEILIFAPLNFVSKFDKNGLVSFEYKERLYKNLHVYQYIFKVLVVL
jgi:hypothetical protein